LLEALDERLERAEVLENASRVEAGAEPAIVAHIMVAGYFCCHISNAARLDNACHAMDAR
jgi:hypothetical protein